MENLLLVAGYLAVAFAAYKISNLVVFMLRCYILPRFGFHINLRKYGEWAVVTGATDGIGKEYVRQLAKRGFKVVLISRNAEKLKDVQEEIEKDFGVETKVITYDFTRFDGYTDIEEVVKHLDIGVLINNMGMGSMDYLVLFEERDTKRMTDMINANILSDVMMTRIVLPGIDIMMRF